MAELLPNIRFRWLDDEGEPLAGGKVYTYEAGSATPQATYTDQTESTPNTNPIFLDINGEADIWIKSGLGYKIIIADADDVILSTFDNITGQAFGSIGTGDVSGPASSVDNELPLFSGTSGKLLKRATGSGFLKVTGGVVSVEPGGGVPAGGDAFALLEKQSADDGDAVWTDPLSYNGYSERYSQLVALDGIKAVADFIMDMGYAPPTASLSSNVSNSLRERGDLVTAMTLSATIGLVLDDIAEVRFYYDGGLIDIQVAGGAIPSGGVSTFGWTGSFGTNKTFSVQVDDDSVQSKPSAVSNRSYSFVYPYYVGSGAVSLSAANVALLTKRIIASTATVPETIGVTAGNVFYFAYPASYGALTSILDASSFETIGDWTLRTENITGLDGNAVSYRIYEFNNPVGLTGSYLNTFKR